MLEGLIGSIGTVGDALDNALCETTIGLYKTECVREGSPFRTGSICTLADLRKDDAQTGVSCLRCGVAATQAAACLALPARISGPPERRPLQPRLRIRLFRCSASSCCRRRRDRRSTASAQPPRNLVNSLAREKRWQ
jgi:hypothetical protein